MRCSPVVQGGPGSAPSNTEYQEVTRRRRELADIRKSDTERPNAFARNSSTYDKDDYNTFATASQYSVT